MSTPVEEWTEIVCPDCTHVAPNHALFILHREREHYGQRIEIRPGGIESRESHGYQPDQQE